MSSNDAAKAEVAVNNATTKASLRMFGLSHLPVHHCHHCHPEPMAETRDAATAYRQLPMLTISHLSKTYANGVRALNDVSLTIDRGLFGLLGPNGAGKSTLMRTIATLQEADSGTIVFDGEEVAA